MGLVLGNLGRVEAGLRGEFMGMAEDISGGEGDDGHGWFEWCC